MGEVVMDEWNGDAKCTYEFNILSRMSCCRVVVFSRQSENEKKKKEDKKKRTKKIEDKKKEKSCYFRCEVRVQE